LNPVSNLYKRYQNKVQISLFYVMSAPRQQASKILSRMNSVA